VADRAMYRDKRGRHRATAETETPEVELV